MPTIQAQELIELSQAIFMAAGTPLETAQTVAQSLVRSNLIGHDSHGVQLIPGYVESIRKGMTDPKAQPTVKQQTAATALVDGNWGFGQIVARAGVEAAARLAREAGLGCAGLSRSNHIGRIGEYAHLLADQGLIGLILTGVSGQNVAAVAPFGGRDRVFGTNPMAWGVPVDQGRAPLILDFATSGVAWGKVAVARSKGLPIAEGLLLDKEGKPTTDPNDLYDGGVLLPFGGHKGYGLALMVELLTRSLAGFADIANGEERFGNPTLIMAWSVESFRPAGQFQTFIEAQLQRVKGSRPAAGFEEVMLPGEPEVRVEAQRSKEGVPVPDTTWQQLGALADELGAKR